MSKLQGVRKRVWYKVLIGSIVVLLLSSSAVAGEREEYRRLAPKYKAECDVRCPDGTSCDLVTECEAIECDWARKWYQSIGQSWHYSIELNKYPAVLLLVTSEKDQRYVKRCQRVCDRLRMRLYVEDVSHGNDD